MAFNSSSVALSNETEVNIFFNFLYPILTRVEVMGMGMGMGMVRFTTVMSLFVAFDVSPHL